MPRPTSEPSLSAGPGLPGRGCSARRRRSDVSQMSPRARYVTGTARRRHAARTRRPAGSPPNPGGTSTTPIGIAAMRAGAAPQWSVSSWERARAERRRTPSARSAGSSARSAVPRIPPPASASTVPPRPPRMRTAWPGPTNRKLPFFAMRGRIQIGRCNGESVPALLCNYCSRKRRYQ